MAIITIIITNNNNNRENREEQKERYVELQEEQKGERCEVTGLRQQTEGRQGGGMSTWWHCASRDIQTTAEVDDQRKLPDPSQGEELEAWPSA